MTEYAPNAIKHLFDTVHAAIPQAILSGIVGDSAHTYGYHRGRNYVGSNDYSVQTPPDKKGNGEAASAIDMSWSEANWQYTVSQRLLNAKNDSRMNPIREFFGSTDGRNVCGWDYYGNYSVTSDDSHLWHVHISVLREYADNDAALQGVAQVITGASGTGDWFDMATQTDLENAVRKVLNEATPQGQTSWANSYKNITYKAAHDFYNGAQNLTVPRIDPSTGGPSMSSPSRHGNVLAYIDYRTAEMEKDIAAIKAKLGIA